MSNRRPNQLLDFKVLIPNAVSPVMSDWIDLAPSGSIWPSILINCAVVGTMTNSEVILTASVKDSDEVEAWLPEQYLLPQLLIDGSTKVLPVSIFDTLNARFFRVGLKTPITGGGGLTIYYTPVWE